MTEHLTDSNGSPERKTNRKPARSFRPPLGIRLDELVGADEALRLGRAAFPDFDEDDYAAAYESRFGYPPENYDDIV